MGGVAVVAGEVKSGVIMLYKGFFLQGFGFLETGKHALVGDDFVGFEVFEELLVALFRQVVVVSAVGEGAGAVEVGQEIIFGIGGAGAMVGDADTVAHNRGMYVDGKSGRGLLYAGGDVYLRKVQHDAFAQFNEVS